MRNDKKNILFMHGCFWCCCVLFGFAMFVERVMQSIWSQHCLCSNFIYGRQVREKMCFSFCTHTHSHEEEETEQKLSNETCVLMRLLHGV